VTVIAERLEEQRGWSRGERQDI